MADTEQKKPNQSKKLPKKATAESNRPMTQDDPSAYILSKTFDHDDTSKDLLHNLLLSACHHETIKRTCEKNRQALQNAMQVLLPKAIKASTENHLSVIECIQSNPVYLSTLSYIEEKALSAFLKKDEPKHKLVTEQILLEYIANAAYMGGTLLQFIYEHGSEHLFGYFSEFLPGTVNILFQDNPIPTYAGFFCIINPSCRNFPKLVTDHMHSIVDVTLGTIRAEHGREHHADDEDRLIHLYEEIYALCDNEQIDFLNNTLLLHFCARAGLKRFSTHLIRHGFSACIYNYRHESPFDCAFHTNRPMIKTLYDAFLYTNTDKQSQQEIKKWSTWRKNQLSLAYIKHLISVNISFRSIYKYHVKNASTLTASNKKTEAQTLSKIYDMAGDFVEKSEDVRKNIKTISDYCDLKQKNMPQKDSLALLQKCIAIGIILPDLVKRLPIDDMFLKSDEEIASNKLNTLLASPLDEIHATLVRSLKNDIETQIKQDIKTIVIFQEETDNPTYMKNHLLSHQINALIKSNASLTDMIQKFLYLSAKSLEELVVGDPSYINILYFLTDNTAITHTPINFTINQFQQAICLKNSDAAVCLAAIFIENVTFNDIIHILESSLCTPSLSRLLGLFKNNTLKNNMSFDPTTMQHAIQSAIRPENHHLVSKIFSIVKGHNLRSTEHDVVDFAMNNHAFSAANYLVTKGLRISQNHFSKKCLMIVIKDGLHHLLDQILQPHKKSISQQTLSNIASYACYNGHFKILKLIENQYNYSCDMNCAQEYQMNPMIAACISGHYKIVNHIINKRKQVPDIRESMTALLHAFNHRHAPLLYIITKYCFQELPAFVSHTLRHTYLTLFNGRTPTIDTHIFRLAETEEKNNHGITEAFSSQLNSIIHDNAKKSGINHQETEFGRLSQSSFMSFCNTMEF